MLAATSGGLALLANNWRHDADVATEAATKSENKAVEARNRAESQARIAESRRLAAEARTSLGSGHPQQALILAVEAVKATRDLGEPIVPATETTLHEVLGQLGGTPHSGHGGSIRALGFAHDGRLVTASNDSTVRVWDLKNPGAEPLVLRGHEDVIHALGFAPDGRLVTAGYDKTARVWELSVPRLISQAKIVAGRDLTPEEWERYFPGQPYRRTFP